MKVGLFIDTFYPMVDGVVKVVDNYASRLAKKCEVVVFCPAVKDYDESLDKQLPYEVVRCHSLPMGNLDYSLPLGSADPAFEIALVKSSLDLVHIHSPFTVGFAGALYAHTHGLPLIGTLHSQYRQDFEKSLKLEPALNAAMSAVMMVFNSCDRCWAVNASIKDLYVNEYGLTSPCSVMLNATDHTPVADEAAAANRVNSRYGIAPGETVLLFVGRINFLKNIDFIVRSLKILKDRGLHFKMIFAGQGQDYQKLVDLTESLGLSGDVVMTGLVNGREDLQDLYSRAKLFLFPSLYDANSLVQIEAACQGTPTVFLKGARTAATVTDGVNALVCEPTEEDFASRIEEVLKNESLYRQLSAAAREQLYLDWDTVVDRVYGEYLAAVEAKKQALESRRLSHLIDKIFNPDKD